MEMPEVKSFNAELSGLYDNKPPISKAKMSAITKGAIKAIKFYKHVVHSVEKFIQKCKPEYKVPGLYVIDSIVRQSRHQFGQEKDVFAPRFAKNMQQTFANLFRCPPEDKRNIIRVLNLWQKNNVFTAQVIQPLLDMADPNHPLHQEIQQQQNNTTNGSSLNLIHNTSENKMSPGPSSQHSPRMSSPMDGNQFQDEPSGLPNMKFNRKLLNDFEYESEDEPMMLDPPLPTSSHTTHTSHSTHTSHTSHGNQPPLPANPTDTMASILTNPEIMRQLQSLQAQMSLMTSMQIHNRMPLMPDMQLQQNPNQPGLPFLNTQDQQNDAKEDMANESDIEFVDAGPQVIEIPDANDSRSPSPKSRRHRSRSKSPRRRGRRSRSRSRSPRRRRDRDRDRERDKERDRDKASYKEREADREKQKEREKKGLPPIKKENLSVCSTTLWVGHLSKLATFEELSDLFGGVGGVVSIDVVAPRGCAFVVMERRRDAHKALTKLNKHKLHTKEIAVKWAPGKGVKGREWKEQWEAELGVSYLPWAALHARWLLGDLQLDALEDGGMVDEETLPPWLPPRIMPKSMMENMSLLGIPPGMISLPPPPGMPPPMRPQIPTDMAAAALGSPANLAVTRMPPPGMPQGLPPGMPPGLPPGIRPPNLPGVPGLPTDTGMPPTGPIIRFPPGMPPQGMGQPGMVGGFLGGLLGVNALGLGNMPTLPNMPMGNMGAMPNMQNMPMFAPVMSQAPPHHHQRPAEGNDDDAMDLDTEEMHQEESNGDNAENKLPPALLPDQIQALLSKPPPNFNASEPPPGFIASEPPPFSQPPPDDKDDDRKDRDRDRRDRDRDRRGDRRDRDRGRNDRGNERRGDRGNERDRDGGRDDRRDRDRGRDRRDRDRDRERGNNRDNNGERPREKSPRQPGAPETAEKSLQERLWEMANGKPADKPRDEYQGNRDEQRDGLNDRMQPLLDNADAEEGLSAPEPAGWPPRHAPPFRPDMRMRGPPNNPRPGAPWMEGPGGPAPFGPRFNGLGPPFRPPFDAMPPPRFDRPPFNRMPFDMNRPPFDGPRPLFDGSRPPFDGMRPPFNGPRPAYDGPRPAYDGPRPAFDSTRPSYDGPRPAYDGPPRFDAERPPFDGPFDQAPEFFDRNNRRFDERGGGEFNERPWDRRPEWDDRRGRKREHEDRPNRDRNERNDRNNDRRRSYDEKRNPRDDRKDDRHRDDRTSHRDDKSASRDDKKDDKVAKDDGVPNAPKDDNAPTDENAVKDRPAAKDDAKDEKNERRRDRQDRKSRWGAQALDEEPPEIEAQEDAPPVQISDEIKQRLQEALARLPQSESEVQKVAEVAEVKESITEKDSEQLTNEDESQNDYESTQEKEDESTHETKYYEPTTPQDNYEPTTPQEKDYEPMTSQEKDYEPTTPQEKDYESTTPQEKYYEVTAPQDKDYEPSTPQEKEYEPTTPEVERESRSQEFELPLNDSSQSDTNRDPSYESESTKQSFGSESPKDEHTQESAPIESEPENNIVPSLYDESTTDVGIDTSFANSVVEDPKRIQNPAPSAEVHSDDIFGKDPEASDDAESTESGA